MNRPRVWELDFLRGAALLGMIAVHLIYDLTELTDVLPLTLPDWYYLLKQYGGTVFVVISGVCAVLGSRSFRRGVLVFSCGMLCTAATAVLYAAGAADRSIIIWFGVLHCLGCCMMLWQLLRHLPTWLLTAAAAVMISIGLYLERLWFPTGWLLIPLGIVNAEFTTSDYFPLLPYLGFFLMGAAVGRLLYRDGRSRFPNADGSQGPAALLCGMGRHSLLIYLIHQPVLAGISLILQAAA